MTGVGRVNPRGMRKTARRQGRRVIMIERGDTFDATHGWTFRKNVPAGSPDFSKLGLQQTNPNGYAIQWHNDGQALAAGTAEHYLPYSHWTQIVGSDDAHTVCMRIHKGTNDPDVFGAAVGGCAIGPGTVLFEDVVGNGVGNGYGLYARFDGSRAVLSIVSFAIGVGPTVEANSVDDVVVGPGDVLALSYRVGVSEIEMIGMVNGVEKVSVSILKANGYEMSLAFGRPGLMGFGLPIHSTVSNSWGEVASEWWVTSGYGATEYEEIPSASQQTGSVKVLLMSPQVHRPGADEPLARFMLSQELTLVEFTHRRVGGPGSAKIVAQLQDWVPGLTVNPDAVGIYEPFAEHWEEKDWHGGEMRILVHYAQQGTPKLLSTSNVAEIVWNGFIGSVEFDQKTRRITITGLGWYDWLNKAVVDTYKKTATLRDAVNEVLSASAVRGSVEGREYPLAGTDVTGLQSILDQRRFFDFTSVTARSALDDIFDMLPGTTGLGGAGMVWGVHAGTVLGRGSDRPYFYLRQALHHYDTDTVPGSGHHFPTVYSDQAQNIVRKASFRAIVNDVTVYGKEDTETNPTTGLDRVRGQAESRRSIEMYGRSRAIESDGDIPDSGIAARIAQAAVKRSASPDLDLTVTQTYSLGDTLAMWHALVPDQPHLAIMERREPENIKVLKSIGETATLDYKVSDKQLRRFGDVDAYAKQDNGATGGKIVMPTIAYDHNLNRSWAAHLDLRFSKAHQGAASSMATVFGRQTGSGRGWGSLIWENSGTGKLYWSIQTNTGSYNIDTGIAVNPTTPADAIVRFTVMRDSVGDFHFWNGATFIQTNAAYRSDILTTHTDDWQILVGKFWTTGWWGDFENFWLRDITTGNIQGKDNMTSFLSRQDNRRVRRNEATGIVRCARFNEAHTIDVSLFTGLERNDAQGRWDKFTWVWTKSAAVDATKILVNGNRRGWRLGDPSQGPGQPGTMNLKKWGGPLVVVVDNVRYRVSPGTGQVEARWQCGAQRNSFAASFAALKAVVDKEAEILRRVSESL